MKCRVDFNTCLHVDVQLRFHSQLVIYICVSCLGGGQSFDDLCGKWLAACDHLGWPAV